MTINFYLEKNKNVKTPAIWIYIRGIGGTIKLHTKQYIESDNWDDNKQLPMSKYNGGSELESYLFTLKEAIKKEWRLIVTDKEKIDLQTLKKRFDDIVSNLIQPEIKDMKPIITDGNDFFKLFDNFLDSKKNLLQHRTIQKYRTLKAHLNKFEKEMKYKLSFDKVNSDFYDKFVSFQITNLKLTNNTIGKYISSLKTFMLWAMDKGENIKADFKKFKVFEEKSDIIYLTNKELMKLYNHDFSENLSLSQVRDLFCFQCFTGQRISDLEKLQREDIRNNTWYVRTIKTRDSLEIPLIKKALSILKKYKDNDRPLPIISQQKTNEYIKLACKLVGIIEKIKRVRYSGINPIEVIEPKSSFVSTHTARRTFVTLSLEKGMRPEIVMEITGHKDYKTMSKYLKLTSKVIKNEMLKAWRD